jgi:(p)ppGpp synthase/HD superfamily hydrolase
MAETLMGLDEALQLAERFHAGQEDKAGLPYIGHVKRVVAAVDSPEEKLAAALHDLLEDTEVTADYLRSAGCPERVVTAVEALTRREGETYEDFVARAARDPIAVVVKRADVADNADESRLAHLPPDEADRLRQKYRRAVEILDEAST